MRILHIIRTVDPASGGPAESVRTLMSFGALGYEGEAVTMDDPAAPFLEHLHFPVHALGPVASTFAYTPRLGAWLRENLDRFDGVIVNGLWNFCGVAAWRQVAGRKPYMVFTHGMLDPYFKRNAALKHAKKWVFWLAFQFWILRRAYRVLFTTEAESVLAEQSFFLHRWRGHVVPYGASRPPGDSAALREAFFGRVPELRGERFILYLGRIHRKKGCDLLIEAFRRYAFEDPALHLVMAGPDEQGWGEELRAAVAEAGLDGRVHWPGMLKGDGKWGAFYACEVFILPSHQENFGIAVAEALGCGRAVLLADKVNIAPEIAADGAGLIEADDQAGTDALVSRWIKLPGEARARMEAQALATFHARYDMEQTARTIIRLFEEVPGAGPR